MAIRHTHRVASPGPISLPSRQLCVRIAHARPVVMTPSAPQYTCSPLICLQGHAGAGLSSRDCRPMCAAA
jgi:hypothetical protein